MDLRGCVVYSAILALIVLVICSVTALTLGQFLIAVDSPAPADAIVVLGGDSDDFVRTRQAVRLFNQGFAPAVVFSTTTTEEFATPCCSRAEQTLQVARNRGLPAQAAVILDGATSTYDEAVRLRDLADEHGWHALIIVTNPFHTRRAGRTFRTLLPDATIYISTPPNPDLNARRWWASEHSLVTVFNETLKLAFYWAKYGIRPM